MRQVLPWVGAAVGAIWGQPGLGFAIGSMLGNALDPQTIRGPSLGEGQNNTASEGGYRPIVLGKGAVGVCLIHEGPLIKKTIRHKQSKGGGPTVEEERHYRTMAFALGESADPDSGVVLARLWIDNKLRYDVTPTSQILAESVKFADQFTFYPGDNAQQPDPDIEAFLGAGNVPSYRGGAPYIVFPMWDVTSSAGRAPTIKAEIAFGTQEDPIDESYDGGQSFPTTIIINCPSNLGLVELDLTAGSIPDKLHVLMDGSLVFDTGYVGSAEYFQSSLDANLASRGMPPETIGTGTYQFPDDNVTGGISYGYKFSVEKPAGTTSVMLQVWAPLPNTGWGISGKIMTTGGTGPVFLSSIVEFLHDRIGHNPSDFYADALDDLVEGVVFADGYTGADAIRSLMGWYFFDAGEFDAGEGFKINYVRRGAPAIVTLADSEAVEAPEDWEREDSYERPRVLNITYQNPIADYGAPVVPIKRTSKDILVVGERSLSVPIVHSDADEVARRGDIALTIIYTEIAGTYSIVLPLSSLILAPTTPIGFSIRGRTRRLRMQKWQFRGDYSIATEWAADRQSAYTSTLTTLPAVPSTPPPPSIVGDTVSAVLDIPAISDSLDNLHLIVAASGNPETAWWGATHQSKLPADPEFSTVASFTAPATIMGVLSGGIADASAHFTDTTNIVRVVLYSDDELQTFTEQQFLAENGAFALAWDDSGGRRWEIMQYRDAVKVGDREWELRTLSRGRLNTETAAHSAGSLFVLLDFGVKSAAAPTAWLNNEVSHRAISNGQPPDDAQIYTEDYTGQSQTEWPVANLFAIRSGSTIVCSCVPRHRFGTDDQPIRSANWTGYRWGATDGTNVLSADTISDSHVFDVSGWGTPITIHVSQLNRITGSGPSVSEEIE